MVVAGLCTSEQCNAGMEELMSQVARAIEESGTACLDDRVISVSDDSDSPFKNQELK